MNERAPRDEVSAGSQHLFALTAPPGVPGARGAKAAGCAPAGHGRYKYLSRPNTAVLSHISIKSQLIVLGD